MSRSAKAIISRAALDPDLHGWKMEDVTVRGPRAGEVLVQMVACGICQTDVHAGSTPEGAPGGFYPRVLGHEGSGYVLQVGPGVTVAEPGDPVLCSYSFCDSCLVCKDGYPSHCVNFFGSNNDVRNGGDVFQQKDSGENIWGGFFGQSAFSSISVVGERSIVNVKGLVKTRAELQAFAPLGCAIQTGTGTVTNAVGAKPDDVICIQGLGAVGLAAVMGARIQVCRRIIGIDRVQSRFEIAKELGVTDIIDTGNLNGRTLQEAVNEVSDGIGPSITIDTTGVGFLIDAGINYTRPKGKYVQVGSPEPGHKITFDAFLWLFSGKQIISVVEGHAQARQYLPQLIEWYRAGRLPLDRFCKFFPAADFQQALVEMRSGSTEWEGADDFALDDVKNIDEIVGVVNPMLAACA